SSDIYTLCLHDALPIWDSRYSAAPSSPGCPSRPPYCQVEERSAHGDERRGDVDQGEPRAGERDATVGVEIDQRLRVPPPGAPIVHITQGRKGPHRPRTGSESRHAPTPGRLPGSPRRYRRSSLSTAPCPA